MHVVFLWKLQEVEDWDMTNSVEINEVEDHSVAVNVQFLIYASLPSMNNSDR